MRSFLSGFAVLALAGTVAAQLTDLQPGRNFVGTAQFGTEYTENIDAGDVDNDGDMDVITCNGGDFGSDNNRIWINMGGLQGGTLGAFQQQTNTRFPGFPQDASRDIEFVDIDNDGDLDVYVANKGGSTSGQTSRFYINQGGIQAGTIGFFQEDTVGRWQTLVSVPVGDQITGGNTGAWEDWSCDCDFGDLDDDGDLDLFHSTYGPSINGTRPSRVFLNDGTGRFDELFPWVDSGADINTHSIDLDLADFDGDFDLDVHMSSRNSQARVYHNNTYNPLPGSVRMFTDITQHALINTGSTNNGGAHYEAEYGDGDGDGDFDIWAKNLNNNLDRFLRNDGYTPGSGFRFTKVNSAIVGDPNVDENEADWGDFDGDGDLDMFIANFLGTNWLYQSGVAQGYTIGQGLFHRTGGGGSDASGFNETPTSGGGGQTLDADWVDVDNDGDEDIIVANDAGQQNRLYENDKGIPDTHAPTFFAVTDVGDKANGSSSLVHAQIRDNSSYYVTQFYNADLIYCVNGGTETTLDMFSQGSMQYRAVIPAQTDSTVSYRVEVTDMAGNTGVSDTFYYRQGVAFDPFTDEGFAKAGVFGFPVLDGVGDLIPGEAASLDLTNAATDEPILLFVSITSVPTPFKGGTLCAFPEILTMTFGTDALGEFSLGFTWIDGVPCGTNFWTQYAIRDTAATGKTSLSNCIKWTAP